MKNKNLNPIIDLRSLYFVEELEKTWKYKVKKKKYFSFNTIKKAVVIAWFVLFFLTIYLNYFYIWKAEAKNNFTLQEKIRLSRLQSCAEYAQVKKIYWQDAITRCATFATIVFAFESNFWKSQMCRDLKNCYWIKGNGVEYPAWFITFENYDEANKYFAKKYFKFHYKKKVKEFVYSWSMTDRDAYISFFNVNFLKIYNEILKLKKLKYAK